MRNEWNNQVKTNGIRMLLVKIEDGKFYIFSIFFLFLFFLLLSWELELGFSVMSHVTIKDSRRFWKDDII